MDKALTHIKHVLIVLIIATACVASIKYICDTVGTVTALEVGVDVDSTPPDSQQEDWQKPKGPFEHAKL